MGQIGILAQGARFAGICWDLGVVAGALGGTR